MADKNINPFDSGNPSRERITFKAWFWGEPTHDSRDKAFVIIGTLYITVKIYFFVLGEFIDFSGIVIGVLMTLMGATESLPKKLIKIAIFLRCLSLSLGLIVFVLMAMEIFKLIVK